MSVHLHPGERCNAQSPSWDADPSYQCTVLIRLLYCVIWKDSRLYLRRWLQEMKRGNLHTSYMTAGDIIRDHPYLLTTTMAVPADKASLVGRPGTTPDSRIRDMCLSILNITDSWLMPDLHYSSIVEDMVRSS